MADTKRLILSCYISTIVDVDYSTPDGKLRVEFAFDPVDTTTRANGVIVPAEVNRDLSKRVTKAVMIGILEQIVRTYKDQYAAQSFSGAPPSGTPGTDGGLLS